MNLTKSIFAVMEREIRVVAMIWFQWAGGGGGGGRGWGNPVHVQATAVWLSFRCREKRDQNNVNVQSELTCTQFFLTQFPI